MRCTFQETVPRTLKHHDVGVGSMVANHHDGCESLVVVMTVIKFTVIEGHNFD